MNWIDLLIGLTLMNAMPHFVLGVWKGRMLSGLGFGHWNNIFYGLLNFTISISLFLYNYGMEGILSNGIYIGGLFVLIVYFIAGPLFYKVYNKSEPLR